MPDQAAALLSPWLRRARLAAVRDRLAGRVLDYGCGVGELARSVAPERYLGVDVDPASVASAAARFPRHRFATVDPGGAWLDSLENARFDTLVLLAVLEHVPEPASLLRRLARHLDPDGRILITAPAPSLEWAHRLGARAGLFSREASEEHASAIDLPRLGPIAQAAGIELLEHRRFLMGANQLFVLRRSRA